MNNTDGYHGTEEQKKLAAFKAAGEIQDNMILGLGTGSTVYHLIVSWRNASAAAYLSMPLPPLPGQRNWLPITASPLSRSMARNRFILQLTAWTPLTRTSIPLRAVAARCSGKR